MVPRSENNEDWKAASNLTVSICRAHCRRGLFACIDVWKEAVAQSQHSPILCLMSDARYPHGIKGASTDTSFLWTSRSWVPTAAAAVKRGLEAQRHRCLTPRTQGHQWRMSMTACTLHGGQSRVEDLHDGGEQTSLLGAGVGARQTGPRGLVRLQPPRDERGEVS